AGRRSKIEDGGSKLHRELLETNEGRVNSNVLGEAGDRIVLLGLARGVGEAAADDEDLGGIVASMILVDLWRSGRWTRTMIGTAQWKILFQALHVVSRH